MQRKVEKTRWLHNLQMFGTRLLKKVIMNVHSSIRHYECSGCKMKFSLRCDPPEYCSILFLHTVLRYQRLQFVSPKSLYKLYCITKMCVIEIPNTSQRSYLFLFRSFGVKLENKEIFLMLMMYGLCETKACLR